MTPAERKRARRAELYLSRKLGGICVHCAAGLQADDGVLCRECRDYQRSKRQSKRAKAALAKASRAWRARNREALRPLWRVEGSERYKANRAEGRCVNCSGEPAPGRVRCEPCLAASRVRSNRWRANRRAA